MTPDTDRLDLSRLVPFGIFAASAAALISAYTAQYVFDLEPCILCLYQRVPYAVAGVLGLAAMFAPAFRFWAVGVAGVAFLIGGGIAFYHVGVEQHWWVSAAACGGSGASGPATVGELRQLLLNAAPVKACDQVDWTLFGFSMATYNVVMSLALAIASFWGAGRIRRAR
jgi:disulfide bond formation protein DsbB